ncbi:hypothetical protein SHVI106290_14295 [Shewanella violacea]|uniref:Uncharacterized protein n=1 Tax=Shewanella violacea (strain JCM 10179 / CIP 106290 / LMG 19151 / DSS12) TaxID=637905 RepID=D4ZBT9_SHEVD|nr:hypothetical protein SVI_3513 [Shewanella violacea DSS12]
MVSANQEDLSVYLICVNAPRFNQMINETEL